MSTTFGVKIPSESDDGFETVKIACRGTYMIWLNPLAQLLPDDLEVIPIDNTAQGIHTIGDIKKEMENN